ncbi:hypothetical protein PWT90_05099 [Aphanocladium album]|nr:hypothetical protein PWT90_05099 [Aphanocladium album]
MVADRPTTTRLWDGGRVDGAGAEPSLPALAVAAAVSATAAPNFDWASITPSADLEYHDCYGSYKCARLSLPLDWLDETSNETIALAIIKSDAVGGIDAPTYAGPVLSNPGGPGGSGVAALLESDALQREMVDTPGKKHFEYVSFDPRGIGFSTPQVNCYPNSSLALRAVGLQVRGSGGLNGGHASLPFGLGLAEITGARCAKHNGDLLKYVGTASVARDMLAIVDKIDAYNKRYSKKPTLDARAEPERRNGNSNSSALPRLQYLGFSYGTVLGNYFASMYPGRVGRVLLDGIVDIDDYTTGDGWLSNTADTDKMADMFFGGCHKAGQNVCALARKTDRSGADISKRVWAWAKSLDENPSFVSKGDDTLVLRPNDFQFPFISALYIPIMTFKYAATIIDYAMQGNATGLYDLIATEGPIENTCKSGNASPGPKDAQSAILCGDGEDITGRNASFWRGYLDRQLAQSSLAGARWTEIRLSCSNWTAKAKWNFKGPFTAPEPSKNCSAPESGRPAAPLFFLSNRYDPVTPLRGARKVVKKYPGAGLLIQETMGHTVFSARAATDCTKNAVRRYFADGVVPSGETTCEAACDPWGPACNYTGSSTTAAAPSLGERFGLGEQFPLQL